MQSIPTDIITYSKLIDNPEKDFNLDWIVPEEDFKSISNIFFNEIFHVINDTNQINKEVFFADLGFLGQLVQYLHADIFRKRTKKKGLKISIGKNSSHIFNPDWNLLSRIEIQERVNVKFDAFLTLKQNTKYFFFNYDKNVFSKFLRPNLYQKALCLGSNSALVQDYAKKNKLITSYKYINYFLINSEDKLDMDKEIEKLLEIYFDKISKYLKHNFDFNYNSNLLIKRWGSRLSYLKMMLKKIVDENNKLPNYLLVTQTMKATHRIVASAFKIMGKNAVAFDHGNVPNNRNTLPFHIQPLSYNKIVTYGRKSAKSLRSNLETFSFKSFYQNLSIESARDKNLYKNFNKYKNKKLPKKNNTIMIIGWPMNSRRWTGENDGNFFFYRILLEVNLIKYLKTLGYKVYYKIHPLRKKGTEEIIKKQGAEIVKKEQFENCWQIADVIIFTHTSTTTFGYALTTNRKIILIDTEKKNWNHENYNDLLKRCCLVNSSFENGFVFSKMELKKSLERYSDFIDQSYIENYLI